MSVECSFNRVGIKVPRQAYARATISLEYPCRIYILELISRKPNHMQTDSHVLASKRRQLKHGHETFHAQNRPTGPTFNSQEAQTDGIQECRTAPAKPGASTIDASKYDHDRLASGFGLFLSDEAGNGRFEYVELASSYARLAQTDGGYRLVKAWPISIAESDIVYEALRPYWVGLGSHLREGPTLAMERHLPKFLERYWKRQIADDAKKAKEEARHAASRVKAHNAFMADLAKHTKALAALAHNDRNPTTRCSTKSEPRTTVAAVSPGLLNHPVWRTIPCARLPRRGRTFECVLALPYSLQPRRCSAPITATSSALTLTCLSD